MAVQQNKKSRSARDMRRSHDALEANALSVDKATGEVHLRHQDLAPAPVGKDPVSAPRCVLGEIQRPDDPGLIANRLKHVLLVKRMIAKRDAIGAGLEQPLGMRAG